MKMKLLVTCIAILASSTLGFAAKFEETWIQNGSPTLFQIQKWKMHQQTRGAPEVALRVILDSSPSDTLIAVSEIPGLSKVQIIARNFPNPTLLDRWKKLAALGAEFVSLSGHYPTATEIQTLNEIGFKRILIALSRYPEKSDVELLSNLKTKTALHFNLNRYPTFLQKFNLALLPLDMPLQFTVDAWPRYVQMDIWNMIPQTEKRLRITDTMLSRTSVPYTQNLKLLTELIFSNDGDVLNSQWEDLGTIPVRWSVTNAVPSERALKLFQDSKRFGAARKLVLDRDTPLSAAERARLEATDLEIEWIHEAP